jgi:hypothetical protein
VTSLLCLAGLTLAPLAVHDARLLGELRLWTVLLAAAIILLAPRDGVPALARWSRTPRG